MRMAIPVHHHKNGHDTKRLSKGEQNHEKISWKVSEAGSRHHCRNRMAPALMAAPGLKA